MTLPFDDPEVKTQQGWVYTDGGKHEGFDYIKGIVDGSPKDWQKFKVVSVADGEARYVPGESKSWGNYVQTKHVINGKTYYTVNAHLSTSPLPENKWIQVKRGEEIGTAGDTGEMPRCPKPCIHLHFEISTSWPPRGARIDPYDIAGTLIDETKATRSYYPGGSDFKGCGPNHVWTTCPPSLPTIIQPPIPEQRTISVNIREEINIESCLRPPRIDPAAETALKQKLIGNGFQVVSTNANISIEGEGFGECMGRFDSFWQGRARLEVKVTETSTGRILVSEALHAGGIDVTPGAAAKRALQRAGERMGECLVLKLNRGWTTPCKTQSASSSSLRQIAEVGVNNFESEVWTGGWDAREGMKEMVERALRDRGIKVVVPVAADLVVSGAITDYRVIYQVNILIFRIGIAYMTVEPQVFNLETAEIERGDEITDFAGGIEILGFRFGFGPQAVAKKISERIADWVESKVK